MAKVRNETVGVPAIDSKQKVFLRAIYERFHKNSQWPIMTELHRELVQDGELDVYRAGQEIDQHYALPHADNRGGVALRLLGFLAGPGHCEETDDFLRIVRLAVRRYQERGSEPRITYAELAGLGITSSRIDRFNLILEHTDFLSGPQGPADGLYYVVWEGIDKYLNAASIEDVVSAFVKSQAGRDLRYGLALPQLKRRPSFPGFAAAELGIEGQDTAADETDARRVFVVHGRNIGAAKAMLELLRSFGLIPVLFRDVLPKTGKPTPYVADVLRKGFGSTHSSVVIMTPDDDAWLRPEFLRGDDPEWERQPTGQARPNVLFEAGMGWSAHDGRIVIAHIGHLRRLTDLEGLHVLHFDGSPRSRQDLGLRLKSAGCPVDFDGDFLNAGDFTAAIAAAARTKPATQAPLRSTASRPASLKERSVRLLAEIMAALAEYDQMTSRERRKMLGFFHPFFAQATEIGQELMSAGHIPGFEASQVLHANPFEYEAPTRHDMEMIAGYLDGIDWKVAN